MISYKYFMYVSTCINVKKIYSNGIKQYLYHYGCCLEKNIINCKIYFKKLIVNNVISMGGGVI